MPDDLSTGAEPRLLEQAICEHRAGHLETAEKLYLAILENAPNHAAANHNLGILFAQKGSPDVAASFLKTAAEAAPQQAQHWVSYAEALVAAGAREQARSVLELARSTCSDGRMVEEALSRLERPPMVGPEIEKALRRAIEHHRNGRFIPAIEAYRAVLAQRPELAEVECNLGSALKAAGQIDEARHAFERAIAVNPDLANAHFNLGNLHRQLGEWGPAAKAYRNALRSNPALADAQNNLGTVKLATGNCDEAIAHFRRALELKQVFPSAWNNLGNALQAKGETDDAIAAFKTSLAQDPRHAEAHNSLGVLYGGKAMLGDAQASFRKALDLRPDFADAHNNLANLLMKVPAALPDAISHYKKALEVAPSFVELYDHLGLALCKAHAIPEAFEWFTRGAREREKQSKPSYVSPHRKHHDQEQRDWLKQAGLDTERDMHIVGGERLSGPAISAMNGRAEREWVSANPQIVVIDDFLTTEAFEGLRHFCLASSIWKESFAEGYLGARPESGFACPLLAQVAEELRANYPAIFLGHPLLYAWSFKYDNRLKGTNIHADFAAVNVNFWITPDTANLDKARGGLVVWDTAAPLDWNFESYNRDERAIRGFLAKQGARSIRISYRANRAVIFDSDLFHETDEMSFAAGYENRRINITLLFGDRKAVKQG